MCTAATYIPGVNLTCGSSTTICVPVGTAATTSYVTLDSSHMPSTAATFNWHWHGYQPPKCPNCGYCYQLSGVREEDGPVPGDGRDG